MALPAGNHAALSRAPITICEYGAQRYFYAFHPVPGDVYVAGGAVDEFLTFGGGVSYAY